MALCTKHNNYVNDTWTHMADITAAHILHRCDSTGLDGPNRRSDLPLWGVIHTVHRTYYYDEHHN